MNREEINKTFVDSLTSLDPYWIKVAVNNVYSRNITTEDEAVAFIKSQYEKDINSYYVAEVAKEHKHILGLSERNYNIWQEYRDGKRNYPFTDNNGDYVEIKVEAITISINGKLVTFSNDNVEFDSSGLCPVNLIGYISRIADRLNAGISQIQ